MMKALGLLIVLAGCFRGGEAQFPRVCIENVLTSKECCPTPPGFTEPCGGPGRGYCANIPNTTVEEANWKAAYYVDDRRYWPLIFFNRSCVCEGNFSGYDCTKCIWGYRGTDCETKQDKAVRRNIKSFSSYEKKKFQRYVDRAKNTVSDIVFPTEFYDNIRGSEDFVNVSVYDSFTALHYYASRMTMPPFITGICETEADCFFDYAHEAVGFLTWHRKFLLEIERALQEVNNDPDWTLPYWDWSAAEKNQCDICTNDYVGANDEDGNLDPESIFASWWTICEHLPDFYNATHKIHTRPCNVSNANWQLTRNPGTQDTDYFGESMAFLPSAEEVDFAMRFPVFDTPPYIKYSNCSFRNVLEGFTDTTTGKYRETIKDKSGNVLVPGSHTLHNQVHIYMNGTMGTNPSSPNDPMFFLHHCNVDRLLETWMRRYPDSVVESALPERGAPPGHNRYEHMVPFFPPRSHVTMFKPSTEFGYDYEELHRKDPTDGNDMGECSAAVPDGGVGVSPNAIGMGVGIGLGLVLVVVVVSVLLFNFCRRNMQPYDPVSAGVELTART
ncbi:tyrosinase-like [Branchiostoma floridae x Branchiostoma belcheri]